MLRMIFAATLMVSGPVFAQTAGPDAHQGHQGMNHGMPAPMVQHSGPDPLQGHQGKNHGMPVAIATKPPSEPGQSAFAAIQEIVQMLENDVGTDWSKVNIEELRQHLIDMNNVTLLSTAKATPVESGLRFDVTGPNEVRASIQRMVTAHAATMNGVEGWKITAANTSEGASLTVVVPAADLVKLRALGFIGVMTHGMHHQEHHLMIAKGQHPH